MWRPRERVRGPALGYAGGRVARFAPGEAARSPRAGQVSWPPAWRPCVGQGTEDASQTESSAVGSRLVCPLPLDVAADRPPAHEIQGCFRVYETTAVAPRKPVLARVLALGDALVRFAAAPLTPSGDRRGSGSGSVGPEGKCVQHVPDTCCALHRLSTVPSLCTSQKAATRSLLRPQGSRGGQDLPFSQQHASTVRSARHSLPLSACRHRSPVVITGIVLNWRCF